ncbi:MAG: lipocalin-like domain-containing protein [Deinococcota bacterium]
MRSILLLALLLVACAPRLSLVDPGRPPSPDTWGPQAAPLEWWYVSAYLPEEGWAFHWAFFKAYTQLRPEIANTLLGAVNPGPFHVAHIAVTDLRSNQKVFVERSDVPQGGATVRYPPLYLEMPSEKGASDGWKLWQEGEAFRLVGAGLDLRLTPRKPPVAHPPGYSGTEETGRMYYISYTRLALEGTYQGRALRGEAWMDHQWGGQLAGRSATWDWFGLQLSNDREVMLYRVKNASGEVVQLAGSWIGPDGRVGELKNLRMTPRDAWTSPSGRSYTLSWGVEGEGFSLNLNPLREDQELLAASSQVAYWEGPVSGAGTWQGQAVTVKGMGEFVAGPYLPGP